MKKTILVMLFCSSLRVYSQGCCSGGSGSPIAGGAAQGVLQNRQFEIAPSYQFVSSEKFKAGDRDTARLFDKLFSNYLYLRAAYGLTKELTMSIETGYFINKTQFGLDGADTIRSSGFGDLILFPRYNVLTKNTETKRLDITLGLGLKVPIGKYNDSTLVYINPINGQRYYTMSPPTVQPTTGSNDFIFYGFFYRGYPEKKFKIFANVFYMRKGWNPLGQKFGDYASVGLFAGKTFLKKFELTIQLRGEWIGKMKYDKNIDMLALYNIDVYSTGSRKLFFAPQLNWAKRNFIFFVLGEFPLYQYVNRVQVASQYQVTSGISYRFFIKERKSKEEITQ